MTISAQTTRRFDMDQDLEEKRHEKLSRHATKARINETRRWASANHTKRASIFARPDKPKQPKHTVTIDWAAQGELA
jgi:hypothetical protein